MIKIKYNKIYDTFRGSSDFLRKFLYLIPIEYRLGGRNFTDMNNFLKESENWNIEKLREYQKKQLQNLLIHAIKHVPFYSDIKLTSDDPFKNLKKFPIIGKETFKDNFNKFKANNISEKNIYKVSTGGTSGKPLEFYLDNSTYGKEWAFVMTAWRRVGFKLGDKMVSFRGVEFIKADKGVFWQDNPIYNMFEMSPFHMSEENLPKYIKKIEEFKPKFLYGYPSAISILANYIIETEIKFPPITAILAISENIYPGQRQLIEQAFKTRFFSFYGMSEKVIMAPECEYDTRYHAFPEYGITEIVDKDGDDVIEGERGELVGTGFLNFYMPFIRYHTEDYAILSEQQHCNCGRNHLLLTDLIGRWQQEMIIGNNGTLISLSALNLHSDNLINIAQYQFVQKRTGELIINIVPRKNYNRTDESRIKDGFYKKVGNELYITINPVDKIPLTARGKFKLLIQNLKMK